MFKFSLPSNSLEIIERRVSTKSSKLAALKQEYEKLAEDIDFGKDTPELVVKEHLRKLREYNDLKDIGMGLVNIIADQRQLRLVDVLEEMGCNQKD